MSCIDFSRNDRKGHREPRLPRFLLPPGRRLPSEKGKCPSQSVKKHFWLLPWPSSESASDAPSASFPLARAFSSASFSSASSFSASSSSSSGVSCAFSLLVLLAFDFSLVASVIVLSVVVLSAVVLAVVALCTVEA